MALTGHDLVRDPVLQLTFQSLLLSTCLRKQSKQSGQLASLADGENEVFDIINCVALYYEKGASRNSYLSQEKFRVQILRQVTTLKALKETVR